MPFEATFTLGVGLWVRDIFRHGEILNFGGHSLWSAGPSSWAGAVLPAQRHLTPDVHDHVALLPDIDVRCALREPIRLKCTVRDEHPKQVPRDRVDHFLRDPLEVRPGLSRPSDGIFSHTPPYTFEHFLNTPIKLHHSKPPN